MRRTIIFGFLVFQIAVGFTACGDATTPGLHLAAGASCAARLQWAAGIGGGGEDGVRAVAAHPDGSAVAAGAFAETAAVGEGPGAVSLSAAGGRDAVVARFDAAGQVQWARRAGGVGIDELAGVGLFPDGDVVVAGSFEEVATVEGGHAVPVTLESAGGADVLLARFDAGGSLRWARRAGGKLADRALAVAALADGSQLVAGEFTEQATFGVGDGTQVVLVTTGGTDGFVARYDPAGRLLWVRQLTGTLAAAARSVAATEDGAVLVSGDAAKELPAVERSLFLARFEADGTRAWVARSGSTGAACGDAVAVLPDGSVVVAGAFQGGIVLSGAGGAGGATLTAAGDRDILVARYGGDGALRWARRAGGPGDDGAAAVAVLPTGGVAVSGRFSGTAWFGEGEPGRTSLTSAGGSDVFVALFDAEGRFGWARRAGGTGHDAGQALAVLPLGQIVVGGVFSGDATFGPGEERGRTLTAAGASDGFVLRLGPEGAAR